jgi:hypothetical protein
MKRRIMPMFSFITKFLSVAMNIPLTAVITHSYKDTRYTQSRTVHAQLSRALCRDGADASPYMPCLCLSRVNSAYLSAIYIKLCGSLQFVMGIFGVSEILNNQFLF